MNIQIRIMRKEFKINYVHSVQKFVNLILIVSSIFILSCNGKAEENTKNNSQYIPAVEAVQSRYGSLPLMERLTGVVKAKNQVEIFPQIEGVVAEVYARNGDIVKKGDRLILLRDNEYQEQLNQAKANYQITLAQKKQAEAQLNKIKLELKRTEALAEKGLSSDAELEDVNTRAVSAEADLDLANARVDQAQATVDEREENLSKTLIKAPVSGSLGNHTAEVGMQVNSNTRLFTLGQLSDLKIGVVLTDIMLNYIKVGQRSEILADNIPSGKVEAELTRISPFLNPVTHSTDAEIDVENPGGNLNPGMFVTVDIFFGESEQATLVPLSALYENPSTGATGVYVARDSLNLEIKSGTSSDNPITLSEPIKFEFVRVEVIAKGRMQAGILGLDENSWVITLGQNLLAGESGSARVNVVNWSRVEELQNMQSQDLLKKVMNQQQDEINNSNSGTSN
jgi:RND family efflux transporter MFP subunit